MRTLNTRVTSELLDMFYSINICAYSKGKSYEVRMQGDYKSELVEDLSKLLGVGEEQEYLGGATLEWEIKQHGYVNLNTRIRAKGSDETVKLEITLC